MADLTLFENKIKYTFKNKSLLTEALHLNEHEAAKWLTKDELDSVKWLPADLEVVEEIRCMMVDG